MQVLLFVERFGTADEWIAALIKSQRAIRVPRNADPGALSDLAGRFVTACEPESALFAKIETVERTVDP